MVMALSKEERIELVLLSGQEGWSQTLCVCCHVSRRYRHPGQWRSQPKIFGGPKCLISGE